MEDFANYILKEKDYIQKMMITYYLSKKSGIYFDKSIVLRTEFAKLFMDYAMIDVDQNLVLTAILLCNCKKVDDAQKIGKLELYAKEGAEYLSTLGFDKRFCKICEEVNRYSNSYPREKESDILELVDQFTGLVLNRVERPAFSTEEALVILKERNLKNLDNRYLDEFVEFIEDMEKITIKEKIEVPIMKKLISLHNNEANAKSFIVILGSTYAERIEKLINKSINKKANYIFSENGKNENVKKTHSTKKSEEAEYMFISNEDKKKAKSAKIKRYKRIHQNTNRALFSKEIKDRVLNHESTYKLDE